MPTYVIVLLILLASSIVQGAVGFAGGLFGIPLLMMAGLSLAEAVSINMFASFLQNAVGAWQLRHALDWRAAIWPTIIRLITLPLGVATLYFVGNSGKDLTSQIVGVTILLILAVQWLLSVPPQDHLHWSWQLPAFGFGGFLLGLCGMGGPMMVLWVMAHRWPIVRAKAFLYFIFTTGMLPQAFFLWLFFGNQLFEALWLGLIGTPAMIAGMLIGLKIASGLHDQMVRRLAVAVLILIAVGSIAVPLLR